MVAKRLRVTLYRGLPALVAVLVIFGGHHAFVVSCTDRTSLVHTRGAVQPLRSQSPPSRSRDPLLAEALPSDLKVTHYGPE